MNGRLEDTLRKEQVIGNILNDLPPELTGWNEQLKAGGRTVDTRISYLTKTRNFLRYLAKGNSRSYDLRQLGTNDIVSFLNSIKTKQVAKNGEVTVETTSDSYQNTYWYCLSSLSKYLYNMSITATNIMKDRNGDAIVGKVKNQDLARINEHRILLTGTDFKRILRTAQNAPRTEKNGLLVDRDICILVTFMTTGMRSTALREINVEDINFEKGTLSVIDKGDVPHLYYVDESLKLAIERWLPVREEILAAAEKKTDALFISRYGQRINRDVLADVVRKYTKKALGVPLSPHKLRSGFCSIMYDKTHDIEFVRRAVGHAKVSVTQRYIVTDKNEKRKSADIINGVIEKALQ